MNPAESLTITRMVRAVCPQQKFDEYTPDAWHKLLEDLPYVDCDTAVMNLGRRQPFIAPSEIRAEVQRIRASRLEREAEKAPDADPDDVPAYLLALRAQRLRIADGAEHPRDVTKLLTRHPLNRPALTRSAAEGGTDG